MHMYTQASTNETEKSDELKPLKTNLEMKEGME